MTARFWCLAWLGVLVPVFGCPVVAADLEREQRLADEIVDTIIDGEVIELPVGTHRFIGIHMTAEQTPVKGAVVILHGRGFHPDWVDLIQPLRIGLVEHGWTSLSIQLPVLEKAATYNDYFEIFPAAGPRIEAALDHLQAEGHDRIVLIAHSCAVHMVQHWIHRRGPAALDRFHVYVGIGQGATDRGQPMREPYALAKMPQPLLDLYGEYDFPAVHRMADERLRLMQIAGHPQSRQITVDDADHYFKGKGDEAVGVIADWLAALP